jgi:outer membrane protein assembly factor BamB
VPQEKRNYPVATPSVFGDKAFLGIGAAPDTGTGNKVGHFWCVDVTKAGDVSKGKAGSALVWHYGGELMPRPKFGRAVVFGQTMSTAAVHDGLVYLGEETGYLHCLDLATGKKVWEHDFKCGLWGSAAVADGKVYVNTEEGDVVIFAAGRQKKVLNTIYMDEPMQSTPVAANGTLYITTKSKLYAIGK